MRVIADFLTDHKFMGFTFPNKDQDEEARIIEIDPTEDIFIIYLNDKKNTSITICEEDLNALGYYKKGE